MPSVLVTSFTHDRKMDQYVSTERARLPVVLGFDMGGTKCTAAIIDPRSGTLITKALTFTHSGADFLEVLLALISELRQQLPDYCEIAAIGIGCAGLIDAERGIIIASNNLKTGDFPLADVVFAQTGLPCFVANDVEAAALGELKFGAGRGCDDFVIVFVGTGVGARMVQGGRIRRGVSGTAGELGQILVDTGLEDAMVEVPAHRTLEYYCSRPGISRLILNRQGVNSQEQLSYSEINSLLQAEALGASWAARSAIADTAELLGVTLANLVNFVNPEMIILGGGVIEQLDGYFEAVEASTRGQSLALPAKRLRMKRAFLGNNAGVLGAAMLPPVEESTS